MALNKKGDIFKTTMVVLGAYFLLLKLEKAPYSNLKPKLNWLGIVFLEQDFWGNAST